MVVSAYRPQISLDRRGLFVDRSYGGGAVMNSIFVSAAKTASKMLVAAASSAGVPHAREAANRPLGPMDHVRNFVMLTIYVNVWILRVLMEAFPPPSAGDLSFLDSGGDHRLVIKQSSASSTSSHSSSSSSSSSSALVVHGGELGNGVSCRPASATAIGRALSHVLGLLNEAPATSRKYEFVLAAAERIINENVQSAHPALLDVNRAALSTAFSRTCDLLRRSLRRSEASTAPWPSRILGLLPMGPQLAAAAYDHVRPFLGGFLPSSSSSGDMWRPPSSSSVTKASYRVQQMAAATGPSVSSSEWLESEKLAHELLWIADKLSACSAAGEAIARWGFASALASSSLTAHPRVQGYLIKITVMLYRDLGRGDWEAAREVRFGILALWLPLLCLAGNGVTSPVLTGAEKWEMERVAEDLIAGLPLDDQEIILRNWLEDFAASESDWPNLQRCFDQWCRHSRELLL